MSNSNRSFAVGLSCIVIGLALHTSTAFAALSDNPPSLAVRYTELDLSKEAGAQELYRRIKRAAHAVCREGGVRHGPFRSGRYEQCVEQAIDSAVRRVDQPLVSALWKHQTRVASIR